nr:fiber protein [Duck aviadenovirus]
MERKRPFLLSSRGSPKSKIPKIDDSSSHSTIDLIIPKTVLNHENRKNAFQSIKISGDIDLTYPFWNDREDQTLNPPLVNPPLYDNKGYLDIKISDPIIVKNDKLDLNFDYPLVLNMSKLALEIDSSSPIYVSNNGISLKIGNGLKVESNILKSNVDENVFKFYLSKLFLKLNSNGSIVSDSNGLRISTNNGIKIDNNSLCLNYNTDSFEILNNLLNLKVDSNSPLTILPSGLAVQTGSGIQILDNKLQVNISDMFYDNNGKLDLKTNLPLNSSNNGIILEIDTNTLTINNALSVKIDAEGGLSSSSDGLSLKLSNNSGLALSNSGLSINYGNGLHYDNGKISIKLNSPLYFNSSGELALNSGSGLSINGSSLQVNTNSNGGIYDQNGLSIKLPTSSGLVLDSTGLYVDCGDGIEINSNKVTLKLSNPLKIDSGNLSLNYSVGLQLSGKNLRVKPGNGIITDGQGVSVNCSAPLNVNTGKLELNYDSNFFNVDSSGNLTFIPNPSYNFVYAEYGLESFGTVVPVFGGKTTNSCKMRPFITLSWLGSTVTGIFRAKIINGECPNMLSSDPIKFGIILDAKSDTQLGQSPKVTAMYPDSPNTIDKVTPSNHYIQYSRTYDELMSNRPTFFDSSDLKWVTISNFIPGKVGSFGNLSESKLYLSTLTYKDRVVLYFVIDISGGNTFFDTSSDSNKQILIIDVPFFYSGLKANVSP